MIRVDEVGTFSQLPVGACFVHYRRGDEYRGRSAMRKVSLTHFLTQPHGERRHADYDFPVERRRCSKVWGDSTWSAPARRSNHLRYGERGPRR